MSREEKRKRKEERRTRIGGEEGTRKGRRWTQKEEDKREK